VIGRCALLLVLLFAALPRPAGAQPLIADLSSHLIGISTGFTGTSVVLFGATDGGGDIVVVVRGPNRDMTVRRKSRVGAIWINTRQISFGDVPGFYAVGSSRPIGEITSPSMRALYQIGTENLRMPLKSRANQQREKEFRRALVASQEADGLFAMDPGKVDFLGDRLFRTTISFPANVPTGAYTVEVFLIRDKQVIAGQTTPLIVSKVGIDARLYDFADRQSLAYGVIAVLLAVMAGWLGSFAFRGT
jgi:uncharacterized protein (TIGR02186 family)